MPAITYNRFCPLRNALHIEWQSFLVVQNSNLVPQKSYPMAAE